MASESLGTDSAPIIVWFRQDLRLADNPALSAAAARGQVLPLYILDDGRAGEHALGGASRWWLHHSLAALDESLGGRLTRRRGDAATELLALCERHGVRHVYWNRCYEPWRIARDTEIKQRLQQAGIEVVSSNGSLLNEPWGVLKANGDPYQVFTPYYRAARQREFTHHQPLPVPEVLNLADADGESLPLDALGLMPTIEWYTTIAEQWQPGEAGAQQQLQKFIGKALADYAEGRDFPAQESISRLSPHLHFGEVSPLQVWQTAARAEDPSLSEPFLRQLVWRDFAYYLLYHQPSLPTENFKAQFDRFPWLKDDEAVSRWQRGETGYPIVDAGMRELWQTGFMHNRVRMIVASFLIKNLLIDWRQGARWFWDCLLDADLAINSASWQWVAGSGTDAAPYFRIFNPVTQGEKFDPSGEYTRRYLPELAKLPDRYLFKPWEAPAAVLSAAGVTLGKEYPAPIVDLKASRERALAAYQSTK